MFLLIGSVGKESACNTGDAGDRSSMSGLGRSSGGGHGYSLQYSCLENPMDRGAWWATYSPWGYKELNMTEVTKYITTQIYVFIIYTHLY